MPADITNTAPTVLADIVRQQAALRADKDAFIFEDRSVTYGALNRQASQVANGLLGEGLQPDMRVAFLGQNSPEYFELLMGVSKASGVLCPINWRLAPPEIAYIINDTKAPILFLDESFAPMVRDIRAQLPEVKKVILLGEEAEQETVYTQWRNAQSDTDPDIAISPDADAIQLYTSGTTGHPKGARLSNRALLGLRNVTPAEEKADWNQWAPNDVSLVAMPCFHIGGTGWGLTGLSEGATGVIMKEFDPFKVLGLIDTYRISKIFMVPAAMKIIVDLPEAQHTDFSSLKHILYGASPIPLDLLKKCIAVFKTGFVQMYGMTETSGTVLALPPEDHDPDGNEKMSSAGKAMPGVEVVILDEDGEVLAPNEVGEIAIRSVANMSGYWNLDEATKRTLQKGWLRTGDAGYMDAEGYVFIHDRIKDMIISGGENIYPAEVENMLFAHPSIRDATVIGVPDQKWGEAVKAIIVLETGVKLSEKEIIDWARTQIASYKCPKSVDFVEVIPRNPSGKVLKKDLRAPYWKGISRAVN